ncbi:competence type IV pilus minor pilin ComGD [Bacillus kwashiorkori]|uniref:competence type IV pilus minor pilin ComGD n=1 Tax=Bacillus kwashiorkori TaxID=1522318 RepID=UPI000783A0D9|nr:competence type IV pilus minor pilin ComGD [Bacillus kwashiorkori]
MWIRKSQKGFTLIEVLLALTIFLMLVSFLPPLYTSLSDKIETKIFLQQLEEDLYYAQQYAMVNRTPVYYQVYKSMNEYRIWPFGQDVMIRRKIPANITVDGGTVLSNYFKSNGNVPSFGTIHFQKGKKLYVLTLHIGRGRFVISEHDK